ncbi:MAG: helix-turn-helix domain-containing protein [Nitrososphaerales archaeon]|jgi:AcrR family transcriptional regulator
MRVDAIQSEKIDAKIVEAALELVGEVGYRGTTTREIARRAGVNEVTLFRRFGSKQSLVGEAISHAQDRLRSAFEEKRRERTGDAIADLTDLALSLMEILARRSESVSAILFEARREPYMGQAAESMMTSALGVAREFFRGYAAELQLDEERVDSISLSVVSFCFFRIVVRERILGGRLTREDRKREFENHARLLLGGVLSQRGSGGQRNSGGD